MINRQKRREEIRLKLKDREKSRKIAELKIKNNHRVTMRAKYVLEKRRKEFENTMAEKEDRKKMERLLKDQEDFHRGVAEIEANLRRIGGKPQENPLEMNMEQMKKESKFYLREIKKRTKDEKIARKDREHRRRQIMMKQQQIFRDVEKNARQKMMVSKILKRSIAERELAKKLSVTKKWKEVIKRNRIFRESQYENQRKCTMQEKELLERHLHEQDESDRLEEMRKLVSEYEAARQREVELGRLEVQKLCQEVAQDFVDFSLEISSTKEMCEGVGPFKSFYREMKEIFVTGLPLKLASGGSEEVENTLGNLFFHEFANCAGMWKIEEEVPLQKSVVEGVLRELDAITNPPEVEPEAAKVSRVPGCIRLCILGPPCSGKRSLATQLAEKYDLAVIDVDNLLSDSSLLSEEGRKELLLGREISEDFISELIARQVIQIESEDPQTRKSGSILLGYPTTLSMAKLIESRLGGYKEIPKKESKSILVDLSNHENRGAFKFPSFDKVVFLQLSRENVFERVCREGAISEESISDDIGELTERLNEFRKYDNREVNLLLKRYCEEENGIRDFFSSVFPGSWFEIDVSEESNFEKVLGVVETCISENTEVIEFESEKSETPEEDLVPEKSKEEIAEEMKRIEEEKKKEEEEHKKKKKSRPKSRKSKKKKKKETDPIDDRMTSPETPKPPTSGSEIGKGDSGEQLPSQVLSLESAQLLESLWYSFEGSYREGVKFVFSNLRTYRRKVILSFFRRKQSFSNFLLKSTDSMQELEKFKTKFNTIALDKRNEISVKNELHKEVGELRNALMGIIEKKKLQGIEEIEQQKGEKWVVVDLKTKLNQYYVQLLQLEINRFIHVVNFLKGFHREKLGLTKIESDEKRFDSMFVNLLENSKGGKRGASKRAAREGQKKEKKGASRPSTKSSGKRGGSGLAVDFEVVASRAKEIISAKGVLTSRAGKKKKNQVSKELLEAEILEKSLEDCRKVYTAKIDKIGVVFSSVVSEVNGFISHFFKILEEWVHLLHSMESEKIAKLIFCIQERIELEEVLDDGILI